MDGGLIEIDWIACKWGSLLEGLSDVLETGEFTNTNYEQV